MKPEILFLKQENVIKAGVLDMKTILKVEEDTFKKLGEGKVIQPSKIFLGIPDTDHWTSYGMSMPAYIGGDDPVIGFKWAAEAVNNSKLEGVPYGIDIVILSNPETMFPKAILDGTITTAMRTAGCAALMAKYNARKNSSVIGLVGAGVIGRTMIMAMNEVLPELTTVKIFDLDKSKADGLAKEFEGKVHVVPMDTLKETVQDSDVVVTETTSRKPFIDKNLIKKNATVIQMESKSYDPELALEADQIVVDSWAQMSRIKNSLICSLYEAGKITQDDVIQLQEQAAGQKQGRTSDDQFIFCASLGMGSVDIAIANEMYKNAKKMGIGEQLTLWDKPLWI